MRLAQRLPMAVTGIERDVFELRKALAQQAEVIKILAAASLGTAALLMNKEGATRAENQQRVDKAIDLAIMAAPQIIGRGLQLNPGLDGVGNS
jgi:arsenate reductase-like glutaredoxin family protein